MIYMTNTDFRRKNSGGPEIEYRRIYMKKFRHQMLQFTWSQIEIIPVETFRKSPSNVLRVLKGHSRHACQICQVLNHGLPAGRRVLCNQLRMSVRPSARNKFS
jgi:hypothetical protein